MKLFVVIIYLFQIYNFFGQSNFKIYSWEEAKKLGIDTVYGISFEKQKLDSLPIDLFKFTQLKTLNLGKNKLQHLPKLMVNFKNLEELNLEKNNFDIFPIEILQITTLKILIINRNNFSTLPDSIDLLQSLEFLDIYATPIMNFPENIMNLKSLKKIDARGISHSNNFQTNWKDRLYWVHIIFDLPCNCAD
ncbi:MAG: leucine-rich repeat domain-containing protein [Flavobacteriia bacterium]|nr:leucine-rich repeat domain-containing protein [Flavobacteriia bacterium]